MKIIISAAGSGGHIYPALSLADSLKSLAPQAEIIFLCTRRNIEKKILKRRVERTLSIDIDVVPRPANVNFFIFSLQFARFLIKLITACGRVLCLLNRLAPDAVVAFGGLGSIPAVCSARLLRIPVLVHEQNVVPGLANRLLIRFARKAAAGFRHSILFRMHRDVVFTGNPIRRQLRKIDRMRAAAGLGIKPDLFTVLVFGGSQGSRFINRRFIDALRLLPPEFREKIQVIHLTGTPEEDFFIRQYRELRVPAKVFPYLHEMELAYSAADLVVCRAGAAALSEISYFALPAILIPYPYARGHQEQNAEAFAENGAAFIAAQDEHCAENLRRLLRRCAEDKNLRERMSAACADRTHAKAADILAEVVLSLPAGRGAAAGSGKDSV